MLVLVVLCGKKGVCGGLVETAHMPTDASRNCCA
jgi:hypothetical protein